MSNYLTCVTLAYFWQLQIVFLLYQKIPNYYISITQRHSAVISSWLHILSLWSFKRCSRSEINAKRRCHNRSFTETAISSLNFRLFIEYPLSTLPSHFTKPPTSHFSYTQLFTQTRSVLTYNHWNTSTFHCLSCHQKYYQQTQLEGAT